MRAGTSRALVLTLTLTLTLALTLTLTLTLSLTPTLLDLPTALLEYMPRRGSNPDPVPNPNPNTRRARTPDEQTESQAGPALLLTRVRLALDRCVLGHLSARALLRTSAACALLCAVRAAGDGAVWEGDPNH